MAPIEEKYLEQWQAKALLTINPFPEGRNLAHGVRVGKPTTTSGNSVPDYKMGFGKIDCDAPSVIINQKEGKWVVFLDAGALPNKGRC